LFQKFSNKNKILVCPPNLRWRLHKVSFKRCDSNGSQILTTLITWKVQDM